MDNSIPFSISNENIQTFQNQGHVLLEGVASNEQIDRYRPLIIDACQKQGGSELPLEQRDTYGKAFQQHMNLWELDSKVKDFVFCSRFGKIAADLLGVNGVRLYHDQALFKEPGGGPTPWHQDQYYWPVSGNAITMWMPLVDISIEMGMLTFASRSHQQGYLGTLPISDESDEVFAKYVNENEFEISCPYAMKAGDATFHDGWILHSAPGNSSDRMREVMTVIWVADGSHVTEPVNENQYADLARWIPGCRPGDLINSKLNPIIYSDNAK